MLLVVVALVLAPKVLAVTELVAGGALMALGLLWVGWWLVRVRVRVARPLRARYGLLAVRSHWRQPGLGSSNR